jgi:hypothetical protein
VGRWLSPTGLRLASTMTMTMTTASGSRRLGCRNYQAAERYGKARIMIDAYKAVRMLRLIVANHPQAREAGCMKGRSGPTRCRRPGADGDGKQHHLGLRRTYG